MISQVTRTLLGISGLLLIACGTAQAQTTIRMEAEDMTLDTYQVEAFSFASNGALINLKGPGFTGSATTSFSGASGSYDITVVYHDENDGQAQLSVSIDGTPVDSWTLDKLVSGGRHAIEANRFSRQIATGYTVNQGDVIKIDGLQGNWDHANVDYIEFVGSALPPPPVADNFAYVAKSGGNYDDPVKALEDSDTWCSGPSIEDPCTLLIGPGRFEIEEALVTKSDINIIGAGSALTTVTRTLFEPTGCGLASPTIEHAVANVSISDISLGTECADNNGIVVAINGGSLELRGMKFGPFRQGTETHYGIVLTRGSAVIRESDIAAKIETKATDSFLAKLSIIDCNVTGVTEEDGLSINLSRSMTTEISRTNFTGPDNALYIRNGGDLQIDDSTFILDFVSTAVSNGGNLVMRRTTVRPKGQSTNSLTAIFNGSAATIYQSTFEANRSDGRIEDSLIENGGTTMVVSHSVISDSLVGDDSGTLKCLFVSDGSGNQLDSNCMPIP
jgi:hypothetical protein